LRRSKEDDGLGTAVIDRKKVMLNGQLIFTAILIQMIGLDFEVRSLGLGNLVTAQTKQWYNNSVAEVSTTSDLPSPIF
jgi:hypothetical protein